MYKIMFVDDDPLVLRKLNQILDWTSLGFEVMASVTDGLQALDVMNTQIPDVMITDINMPNMDGIQLARKIKKAEHPIQLIMLTVNDSFGCAQAALNIGVTHYLLKPIEKNVLSELIYTVLDKLQDSRLHSEYVATLQDKALISEKMIKDKYLNWFVSGRQALSEEQIRNNFRLYNIPIEGSYFEILSIHMNDFAPSFSNDYPLHPLLSAALQCIENTLCNYENCIVFSDSFYHIIVLLGSAQAQPVLKQNPQLIAGSLRDTLLFELNMPVTIFYSRKYKSCQNIFRCYFETKYLSRYTQGIMAMGIISYENFISGSNSGTIDFDAIRSNILRSLRTGDLDRLRIYVDKTINAYAPAAAGFETYNIMRIDFIMTGILFMQENKANLRDIFDKYFDPLSEIAEKDEPMECIRFIHYFYEQMLIYANNNKISSGKKMVEKCMELIAQNIANPELSVKWLASQLYINDNYLSRQFHKETACSLLKYINNEKLEKARNYLNHGYQNLQTVSKMTGFSDPLYFSKCFKKKFGVAPSIYLNSS